MTFSSSDPILNPAPQAAVAKAAAPAAPAGKMQRISFPTVDSNRLLAKPVAGVDAASLFASMNANSNAPPAATAPPAAAPAAAPALAPFSASSVRRAESEVPEDAPAPASKKSK